VHPAVLFITTCQLVHATGQLVDRRPGLWLHD
jgi:hypothetical protein